MNKENAIKACRQGAMTGFFVVISTFALFLVAKFGSHSEGFLGYFNNDLVLRDCALILFLSFGIYKCSRIIAFTTVILYFFSNVILYFKGFSFGPVLNVTSLIVSLFVFLLLVNAARGSISFHQFEILENPNHTKTMKIWHFVGIPVVAIFGVFLALGSAVITGLLPGNFVQSGDEMSKFAYRSLIDAQIISDTDKVKYIYVNGSISWVTNGQLLTQDSLIVYYTDEDGVLEVLSMPYESITNISMKAKGEFWLSDSLYSFESLDNSGGCFSLSVEDGGDVKFIAELNRMRKIEQ